MDLFFQKITVELPNQPSTKEKRKSVLHAIGGGWYMDKLGQKLPCSIPDSCYINRVA